MTTPTTEMRLRYLATEKGGQLRVDAPAAYSIVRAHDHGLALGASASLAATEAYLASVDPTITVAL